VLLHLQDQTESGELHPQLSEPWAGRAEVHQATGMVVVQLGVSISEAFVRMRAFAYAEDRSILDVGRDVVAGRLRFRGVR
jgi:AmiR/NasT family two-component response regulator